MHVKDLAEAIDRHQELTITAPLKQFEIDDDASAITVHVEGHNDFAFDFNEESEAAVAKYLKVPPSYLKACPTDLKVHTVRYWLNHRPDAQTVVEAVRGELVALHSPAELTIPLRDIARVVTRVFDPDDKVDLRREPKRAEMSITSPRFAVDVPNPDNVPGRPQVGDITHGGVRLLSYPTRHKPPSVMSFFERLVCTNGMCSEEKAGQIVLQGRTVPEIIDEMELAARRLLDRMPEALDGYARMAEVRPPGSPLAFVEQLAREANLSRRVVDEAFDTLSQINGDDITLYDVANAMTSIANSDSISPATRVKLQTLGGELALNTEETLRRCASCERLL